MKDTPDINYLEQVYKGVGEHIKGFERLRSKELDKQISQCIKHIDQVAEIVKVIIECIETSYEEHLKNNPPLWHFKYDEGSLYSANPDIEINSGGKKVNNITLESDEWFVFIYLLQHRGSAIPIADFVQFFAETNNEKQEDTRRKLATIIGNLRKKLKACESLSITMNSTNIVLKQIDAAIVKKVRIGRIELTYIVNQNKILTEGKEIILDEKEGEFFTRLVASSRIGGLRKNKASEQLIESINRKIYPLGLQISLHSKKYIIGATS